MGFCVAGSEGAVCVYAYRFHNNQYVPMGRWIVTYNKRLKKHHSVCLELFCTLQSDHSLSFRRSSCVLHDLEGPVFHQQLSPHTLRGE